MLKTAYILSVIIMTIIMIYLGSLTLYEKYNTLEEEYDNDQKLHYHSDGSYRIFPEFLLDVACPIESMFFRYGCKLFYIIVLTCSFMVATIIGVPIAIIGGIVVISMYILLYLPCQIIYNSSPFFVAICIYVIFGLLLTV